MKNSACWPFAVLLVTQGAILLGGPATYQPRRAECSRSPPAGDEPIAPTTAASRKERGILRSRDAAARFGLLLIVRVASNRYYPQWRFYSRSWRRVNVFRGVVGSARVSSVGDGVLAIADFSCALNLERNWRLSGKLVSVRHRCNRCKATATLSNPHAGRVR